MGAMLVEKHAAKHWKFLHLDKLEKAPDAVRAVLSDIKKGDPKLESIKVLAIVDFNVSFARDVSRLSKLAQVVRQILDIAPETTAAWIIAPTHPKQKSTEPLDEETVKIFKAFRAEGLDANFGAKVLREAVRKQSWDDDCHAVVCGQSIGDNREWRSGVAGKRDCEDASVSGRGDIA